MPKMYCRACGYTAVFSEEIVAHGMQCPECFCDNMKDTSKRKEKKKNRIELIQPITMRALIGGTGLLLLGMGSLAAGLASGDPGRLLNRMVIVGIACIFFGLGTLGTGIALLTQDLKK
jgi:hypothetical protein